MVDLQKCGNTRQDLPGRPIGKGLTILIVDDNPDMRAYVRYCLGYLESQVAQIIEAADGPEALKLARRIPPDLVVSDIVMPGLDGYELCKALKKLPNVSHVRVLLISGETDDRRFHKAGADAFLGKPFNAERMRACLNDILSDVL